MHAFASRLGAVAFQNGKRLLVVFAIVAFVGSFLTPTFVHAETAASGATPSASAPPAGTPAPDTAKLTADDGITPYSPINYITSWIGQIAMWVGSLLMNLTVVVMGAVINIMTYNNFGTSQVIGVGWAIVRDAVNMFFVIVLIAIAMGTIFGVSRFNWSQQIPRLLLFAILINFSRTLAELMIDFSQVIMLTFANAVRDIAAGNFLQMLGLDEVYTITTTTGPVSEVTKDGATGIQGFDLFAAGLATLFLSAIIFGTMVILLAILAMRIVMLWILIILAPLAWFIGGAKGIVSSGAYEQWWKKFVCWCAIGPVIVFFLWLALAVAGSGNIAVTEGLVASPGTGEWGLSDLILRIFESHRFMSFVIGIAMLYAGFEAAQEICGGASGMVSGMIGKMRKGVVPLALAGGLWAGIRKKPVSFKGNLIGASTAWLTRGALAPTRGFNQKVRTKAKDKVGSAAATLAKSRFVPTRIARKVTDWTVKSKQEDLKNAYAPLADTSRETKLVMAEQFANSKPGALSGVSQLRAQGLVLDMMKDPKMRDQLVADGNMDKFLENAGGGKKDENGKLDLGGLKETFKGDPEKQKQISDWLKFNAHLTGHHDELTNRTDFDALPDEAWADPKIVERAKEVKSTIRGKDGEMLNMAEAAAGGHFGTSVQKMLHGEDKDVVDDAGDPVRDRNGKVIKKKTNIRPSDEAKGVRYQNMNDEDLKKVSDEDLAANLTEKMIKRLEAKNPKRLNQLTTTHMDGVKQSMQRDSKVAQQITIKVMGVDKSGKVTDAKQFSRSLSSNPSVLGLLSDKQIKGDAGKVAAKKLDDTMFTWLVASMKSGMDSSNPADKQEARQLYNNVQVVMQSASGSQAGTRRDQLNSNLRGLADDPRVAYENFTAPYVTKLFADKQKEFEQQKGEFEKLLRQAGKEKNTNQPVEAGKTLADARKFMMSLETEMRTFFTDLEKRSDEAEGLGHAGFDVQDQAEQTREQIEAALELMRENLRDSQT